MSRITAYSERVFGAQRELPILNDLSNLPFHTKSQMLAG